MSGLEGQLVLVTGGGGFVGLPTIRSLVGRGASVRVFDLEPSAASGLDCELMSGDISDIGAVRSACEGVDAVVHLAVLPLTSANTQVEQAFDVNVSGSFNVFRAAGEAGVRRVVYSSASSAYGPTEAVPIREELELLPVAFYPATKAAGEMLLRGLAGTFDYDFMILRYMNVYGPGQRAGVVPAVARALLADEPPSLSGDGTQAFDFVHIDDCAQANTLALVSPASGVALNVGSGAAVSLNELAATMGELLSVALQPTYHGDISTAPARVGEVSRARDLLGFAAKVSLRDGLRSVLEELGAGGQLAGRTR